MGLDLSRLDLGAMAASAGNTIGNLGLDVPDWGAYGRNYAAAQLAQQQLAQEQYKTNAYLQAQGAGDQAAMEREQFKGMQSLGLEQYKQQFNAEQKGLDRQVQAENYQNQHQDRLQQMLQTGQYQQGQLAVGQGNLDVNKQQLGVDAAYKAGTLQNQDAKMQQDLMFKTAEAFSKMKQEEAEKMASFAGVTSLIAKNHKEQLPALFDGGVRMGIISPEQAEMFKQMPADQVYTQSLMMANAGSHGLEYLKLSQDKKGGTGDGATVTLPDGTVIETTGAQKKVVADAQQQIANTIKNGEALANIVKSFNPKFLTMTGGLKGAAGEALSYFDLGDKAEDYINKVTGGAVDAKMLKQFATDRKNFQSQVATFKMEFIKAMSGLSYTDNQMKAMEDAIMTEKDSPAAFIGKAQGLSTMLNTNLKAAQQVVDSGIPRGTPEFQKAFDENLKMNVVQELEARNLTGVMIGGTWTPAENIIKYATDHKVSVRELLERRGVFK